MIVFKSSSDLVSFSLAFANSAFLIAKSWVDLASASRYAVSSALPLCCAICLPCSTILLSFAYSSSNR